MGKEDRIFYLALAREVSLSSYGLIKPLFGDFERWEGKVWTKFKHKGQWEGIIQKAQGHLNTTVGNSQPVFCT